MEFMARREYQEWIATPTILLSILEEVAELLKINVKSKGWPKAPNSLSRKLNELKPSLRDIGLEIEFTKSPDASRTRLVKICKISSEPSEPSETQNQARNEAKTLDDTMDDNTDEIKSIQIPSKKYNQNYAQIHASDDMDDMDDTLRTIKGDPKQN
jgi:hypothetical protein